MCVCVLETYKCCTFKTCVFLNFFLNHFFHNFVADALTATAVKTRKKESVSIYFCLFCFTFLWLFFIIIYDEFSSPGRALSTSSLGRAPPKMLALCLVGAIAATGSPTVRGSSCNFGRAAESSVIFEEDFKFRTGARKVSHTNQ